MRRGLLSLINDCLLNNDLPPLGFVNPLLYTIASDPRYTGAFNSITIGDNNCEELDENGVADCCKYGFKSASGWDPVNGLGSPNFAVLKEGALAAAGGMYIAQGHKN